MEDSQLAPQKILLDRRSAAAALSISIRSLDILVATKQLASRRVGRRRLIPRVELERFARRDHRTQQERKGNEDAGQGSQLLPQQ